MVLPRGLKSFLQNTAPGKLTKAGKYNGYRALDAHGAFEGPTLKGITKRLAAKLYSNGVLDDTATSSTEWTPTAWKGTNGGLRRGKAVDSQVSRLAGATKTVRAKAKKFKFSSLAFSALENAGLEPIVGQRVALSKQHGIATAADMVCFHAASNSLVVVELKCGFSGNRVIPAVFKGKTQKMNAPCSGAEDCILNRHLAQLTVTRQLLEAEPRFKSQLQAQFGISAIKGVLLYVCDRDTQLHELSDYWRRRGRALVQTLAAD